ncbi:hypothetical protein NEOLEDRAFT_1050544, partial [Neolentinus lepideus HHB14362 ss-1]
LIQNIGDQYHLNEKQWIAFHIVAKFFIQTYHERKTHGKQHSQPLRMLLTGPGGTGKSHVVKALHEVMAAYGCQHQIRFAAPTGSAATLIDGMTIHKAFGINIRAN